MDVNQSELHHRITRLLGLAVSESGQSTAQIARNSRIKWDTLRRTLDGKRRPTICEIVAILEAIGLRGDDTLRLMFVLDDDLVVTRAGSDAARFLSDLLQTVPSEIVEQLGDDMHELRPRWAKGTAKMLARTLSQHIIDLNRRGDAIGERYSSAPTGG